jgi:hypothetical protein
MDVTEVEERRPTPRWWAIPLAALTVGLAVVTAGALRAVLAEANLVQLLRLVIEGFATGFLALTTWRVATGRSGARTSRRRP